MRAGMTVVAAVAPFFLLPILGMILGRAGGGLGILGGTALGFFLAIGIGRLLGKRVEGGST